MHPFIYPFIHPSIHPSIHSFIHSTFYFFFIKGLLSKIREKRAYIESAKDLIKRRYNEIEQVEKKVHEDIKQYASEEQSENDFVLGTRAVST